MAELTIGIVNFVRDDVTHACVKHLLDTVEIPFRLNIAEQGKPTRGKTRFYDELQEDKRCNVHEFPRNYGLGPCLKHLFDECKTRYHLFMHDDCFPRLGSIETLISLMKVLHEKDVRVVCPVLWQGKSYRYLTKAFRVRKGVFDPWNLCGQSVKFRRGGNFRGFEFTKSDTRYVITNYGVMIFLCDTEIRNEVNWDPYFIAGRHIHSDIFLQLSKTKWWRVATTPDAIFDHGPDFKRLKEVLDPTPDTEKENRLGVRETPKRMSQGEYLKRKFGLKEVRIA